MNAIEYFKLQSKNLHKDFKTQKPYFDPSLGHNLFEYAPKFFDVDALVTDFDIDEADFTLMNAQHIIAKLVGFKKWTQMLKASTSALDLAKLLFDNQHKIRYEEWEDYCLEIENENNLKLDDEDKLDIFKQVFADVDGHETYGYDYRLGGVKKSSNNNQFVKPKELEKKMKSTIQISDLPLSRNDLKEFINVANYKFEELMQMMEPENPAIVRKSWNPERYIDEVLTADKLPIDRNYALSLVESFLIHHFLELGDQSGQ